MKNGQYGPGATSHNRLVLALLMRLPVVLHAKRLSATDLTHWPDEDRAATIPYSPNRLPIVLLVADVRFESEMLRLVVDCTLQLLIRPTALNTLVLSSHQYPDERREDGLPCNASASCVMIIR